MTEVNSTTAKLNEQSPKEWMIYVLKCPITMAVRYVGWTYDMQKRLYTHRYTARKFNRHRDCWIRKLLRRNLFPVHEIIERGTGDWAAAERKWIAYYRCSGASLTNLTDGGEGVPGHKMSPEAIERIRQKNIGRKQSAESVALRAAAMKGHKVSLETRAKISAANTGKIRTAEHRSRLSAALKGRKRTPTTPEQRAAQSLRLRRLYAEHPERKPKGRVHEELAGQVFGRLKALAFVGKVRGKARWSCVCICGRVTETYADSLKRGVTKSCGCLAAQVTAQRNRLGSCVKRSRRVIDGRGQLHLFG